MRCALFGPTPGSRPSSSIRSWRAPSYTSEAGQSHGAEATREGAHLLLGQRARAVVRVPERDHHEILERLDVVRVNDRPVDLDGENVSATVQSHRDEAAAGRPGHLGLGKLLLGGDHLLLHLL